MKAVIATDPVAPSDKMTWVEFFYDLRRRLQNWRVRHVGKAYRTLSEAMRKDSSYAHSWYCNIVMPIYDCAKGKLTIEEANEIGDRLMQHLFDVKGSDKP